MRPLKALIPIEEAKAICDQAVAPMQRCEEIALTQASGRVLAETVQALFDVPPFPRAVVDGYALRAGDVTAATKDQPRSLICVERIYTGQVPSHTLGPGECAEIATGGLIPPGADAVIAVEETAQEGESIVILGAVPPQANITKPGADIPSGAIVLQVGEVLNPSKVGVLAALGRGTAKVFARPRVAIIPTGNEVAPLGFPLRPGQIYDINSYTLAAVVEESGALATLHAIVEDSKEAVIQAVKQVADHELVVLSGGSSVGERDVIIDVLQALGEVLFHGIAVKPGKPTIFGRIGPQLFFGMPGYPTSCLSNAYMLLQPVLRKLANLPAKRQITLTLPLSRRVVSMLGKHQYLTVRVNGGEASPAFKESGDITSMSNADGYIEIPASMAVLEKGALVEVKLF